MSITMEQHLLERVACPICDGTKFTTVRASCYPQGISEEEILKIYSSSSDHTLMDALVKCDSCDLLYLNPRVREDIILSSYSSAVDPVFFEQNPMRIATFRRSLTGICKRWGLVPDKSIRVLDVGCAGGAFVKAAADMGFSPIGIEPSAWLCEAGKTRYGLDLRPGILSQHPFPDKHFQIISMWDVIEHLTRPGEVLTEIHRILADKGTLIVNYPDFDSLVRKIFGWRWPFFLSVHLFYFTPATIRKMLGRYGFEAIELSPHFQTLKLGYLLHRAGSVFKPFEWIAKFVNAIGLGNLPLRYQLGQTLVVARKK